MWRTDAGNARQVCGLRAQSLAPRVVHAQQQPVVEAPVERCLKSVVDRTGSRLDILNLSEPLIRAHEVHRQRSRTRNSRTARRSRVQVLSEVGCTIRWRVETSPLQEVRARCADIRDVQDGLQGQLVL